MIDFNDPRQRDAWYISQNSYSKKLAAALGEAAGGGSANEIQEMLLEIVRTLRRNRRRRR